LLQILFAIIFPYYEILHLCDKRDISSKESNIFQQIDEESRKEILSSQYREDGRFGCVIC
jgi:hypothetical protein